MTVFTLRNPKTPWGDYGEILFSGMTSHLPRQDGLLQLERTGPFVPPISLSGIGDVLVTAEFKHHLEESPLTGLAFRPVLKERVVWLEWEKWPKEAEHPPELPDTGEPEDYILHRPHSLRASEAIGDIWELVLEDHAHVRPLFGSSEQLLPAIHLDISTWDGTDVFTAPDVSLVFVSVRAKAWLEHNAPSSVAFEPVRTD
jgi:hypothetical protein